MVVNVYVEGGIINGNVDAMTINNSEALREELHRFMQRALNRNDISVVVKKCSGYKEAAKQFINAAQEEENYLYVDLDRKPELRNEWFKSLSDDGLVISQGKTDHVIFWIQEMEAWFLKQPVAIELYGQRMRALNANQDKTVHCLNIPPLKIKISSICNRRLPI